MKKRDIRIAPFKRIRDRIGTKGNKTAKIISNLPSSLMQDDIGRVVKYLKLFGPAETYQVIRKNFRHAIDRYINMIPVINKKDIQKRETLPETDAMISVVIPVKNAGNDFRHLLSLMKDQKGFRDIEIIVVDSGSTDRSLEISKEFGAKVVKIQPDEFSHSYARNLGAEHSSGDYLLFTVQDALPTSELWLGELFSVVKANNVVAVSCTELHREDVDMFYEAISWNHNKFMEVDKQDRILCKPDNENHLTLRKNGQLSNVACLISSDVFKRYKYIAKYAEDLDLGIRLIKDGYKLALLSSTRVIHSHNRPAYYYLKRGYVDNLWMSQILPGRPILSTEAKRLFSDIVFTCEVVNSMVYTELERITVPCTIKRLSGVVMKKYRIAFKGPCPPHTDMENTVYFDSKFESFLGNIQSRYYVNGKCTSPCDRILLEAMKGTTMLILEYMSDKYDMITDGLLEEFKRCIYKAYALQCGIYLASCFMLGSKSTKEKLTDIHDELSREI